MKRLALFCALAVGPAGAQIPLPKSGPAATSPVSADDRRTPRGTVFGFLEACGQKDYVTAVRYLNLSAWSRDRREREGPDIARELKRVLDRKLKTDLAQISDQPAGDLRDALAPDQDLVGTVTVDGRKVDLRVERIPDPEGDGVWLFSSSTVAAVPRIYDDIGNIRIEQKLPTVLVENTLFDAALWQWLGLIVIGFVSQFLSRLLAWLILSILRPIASRTATKLDDSLLALLGSPFRLLAWVILFRAGLEIVMPPLLVRAYLTRALAALAYTALAWMAIVVIDIAASRFSAAIASRRKGSAAAAIQLVRRSAKVLAVVIAVLATLGYWGYDTSALLTGLGIGGLAVALAAQKTIEHLFGGVAIITDAPVIVGDFCRFGDKLGTVEDIGLRSTRLRTLDRTVVSVPNGQFSNMMIENFGRRDQFWFHPSIPLMRTTTPDQIRTLLRDFDRMLTEHPKVAPGAKRVRFLGIGPSSLDMEIFAYVLTSSFDEYQPIHEDLMLRVLDLIERAGTKLAVPMQISLSDSRNQ